MGAFQANRGPIPLLGNGIVLKVLPKFGSGSLHVAELAARTEHLSISCNSLNVKGIGSPMAQNQSLSLVDFLLNRADRSRADV
jgi:hypothetical protein